MKGLLRNNFYSMGTNLQLAFGISLVLVFVPLVLGEENILITVLTIQSFMFIANIGTALNTDITSKWSNFEITLPVKRNDILKAKYISFLMLVLCGVFMSALTSLLSYFIFDTLSLDTIIFGIAFGVSLSLLTSALMYPIMLKIGTEKNELIIFICMAIATALLILVLKTAAPFVSDHFIIGVKATIGFILTLISISLFIMSFFVSSNVYKRKEL